MHTNFGKKPLLVFIATFCIGLFVANSVLAIGAVSWTQIYPSGNTPPARFGPGSAYDPNTDRLIMFAGWSITPYNTNNNDVWVLKNATGRDGQPEWVNLIPGYQSGSPTPRHWYGATYDPANNRLMIFGGCGGGCYPTLNDMWILTNANGTEATTPQWIQLSPTGTPPAGRASPRLSYDPDTNRLILFSGQNGSGYGGAVYNDVWILTNANGLGGTPQWINIVSSMPIIGQYWASTAYDEANNRLLIFGGINQYNQNTNGVWVLTNANGLGGTPQLVNLIPDGAIGSPPKAGDAAAVYVPAKNQLLVFIPDGTTWILDNANGLEDTPIWTQLSLSGSTPVGRAGPAYGYNQVLQRFVMWGGHNGSTGFLSDSWWLTLNQPPTADAGGPYTVDEGSSVTLTATGSDPDSESLTYAWDLDNNGLFETPGQSVSFAGIDGPSDYTVSVQITDDGGLIATAQTTVHVNNISPTVALPAISIEPSIEGNTVTASTTFADPGGTLDAPFACTVNYGDGTGDLPGIISGNTCAGPDHAYPTFGTYAVTFTVTDKDGGTGSNSSMHTVTFNWTGFFSPVDNLPIINLVKAGQAIPVKFSLSGNKGLNIFAPGYPQSKLVACNSNVPLDDVEQTVTAGLSSLTYDPLQDQYIYIWKTDKDWAGTCRMVTIKLIDGTIHQVVFKFK